MAELVGLAAEPRERTGKGGARAVRRGGRVPAIVYGDNKLVENISLDSVALFKAMHQPGFFSTLFEISLGAQKVQVVPRDVQLDPVNDQPIHADFLRVGANTRITVQVPVHFINEDESIGLTRGGVLNIVRHEVAIVASAGNLPHELVIDLAGLDIGDSVHISSVTLPEGARPEITDRDFTIATIAAPTVMREEAEEGEGADEGEDAEDKTDGDDKDSESDD
ncbi:MAG: 50S ribosomal protein L25/general stress protein Ctc [Alphaproteobacteria bacterium]